MANASDVKPGTKFRYHHADSNPLWRVKRSRGRGVWECEIDPSEPDYAGSVKVFGTEEIVQSLASAELWARLSSDNGDFWANRRIGETLHYHDSFGRFVRGEVVQGFDKEGRPAKVLKPSALVGDWHAVDLPRWSDAGWFNEGGYHVKNIAAGVTMQPHSGSIWESSDFRRPMGTASSIDPTALAPIDLSRPEPTERQAEAARLLEIVNSIRSAIASEGAADDFAAKYRSQIADVVRIVAEAGLADEPYAAQPFSR